MAFDIDGTLTDTMAHLYETDTFLQQYAIEKYPQVKAEDLDEYIQSRILTARVTQKNMEFIRNHPEVKITVGEIRRVFYQDVGKKYEYERSNNLKPSCPETFADDLYDTWQKKRNEVANVELCDCSMTFTLVSSLFLSR